MIGLNNVVVATRVKEYGITQVLPAARSKVELNGKSLMVLNDDSPTMFEFDNCVENTENDEMLLTMVDFHKILTSLFHGVSVGMLGIGMENEKPGSFSTLIKSILNILDIKIKEQSDREISLSFDIYGVSDTSCIDLLNYSRKELHEIRELKGWSVLNPVLSTKEIIESIEQGYSLPCVILVRLFVKPNDESLPGAMSTLFLADLGSVSGNSALEKSFAQLRTEQKLYTPNYLTWLIDDYFGGNALTVLIADVPKVSVTRTVLNYLSFLSSIRHIKNRPIPNLETPEMIELAALVETHGRLEIEHRSVRRELKHLRKALKIADTQHEELLAEQKTLCAGNEIKQWEYEYEIAKLAMDKVAVHERIRQCEIDLVCMEHERLVLLAEMELKQKSLSDLEDRLKSSLHEKEKIEREFSREIDGLSQRLHKAQKKLELTEQEKISLESNLRSASTKISDLENKIKEIQEKLDIRKAEGIREQTAELKKLKAELNIAKESETALQKKMIDLEKNTSTYQSTVKELESKLSELKLENVTLLAKIEVLSKKPQSPEISRTLKEMEEKWKIERDAMRNVMDDLRKVIHERDAVNKEPNSEATKKKNPVSKNHIRREIKTPIRKTTMVGGKAQEAIKNDNLLSPKSSRMQSIEDGVELAALDAVKDIQTEDDKNRSQTKLASSRKRGLVRAIKSSKSSAKIEIPTAPINIQSEIKQAPVAKTTIKLQPKSRTKIKTRESVPEKPIGKILEVSHDGDVEIPGTPQKTTNSNASPTKIWKPSAFIPGVSRKAPPTLNESTIGGGGGGLFSNFNFANRNDETLRKRIKLPERVNKLVEGNQMNATFERKNVDPTVFSTIIGSFNIPDNLTK